MSQQHYQEISLETIGGLKAHNQAMSKGEYKTKSLRHRPDPQRPKLKKPRWIKAKLPSAHQAGQVKQLKKILRQQKLNTVCEQASCPNLAECFSAGTATFMIMGSICTRKCPFCDVAHGRPQALDPDEPQHLAETVEAMGLSHVVITSVDRDDLRDGGARHFQACIHALRQKQPNLTIETLVPDFRGRLSVALDQLSQTPPDVMNHNLETIPQLYAKARPGADYQASLTLLQRYKQKHPKVLTKSGLMVGLGETMASLTAVMQDLRDHQVDMLTVGQYLQPSEYHLAVERYWTPDEFKQIETLGYQMGFTHVASGPMVRSSYHADAQAHQAQSA